MGREIRIAMNPLHEFGAGHAMAAELEPARRVLVHCFWQNLADNATPEMPYKAAREGVDRFVCVGFTPPARPGLRGPAGVSPHTQTSGGALAAAKTVEERLIPCASCSFYRPSIGWDAWQRAAITAG